MRQYNRAVVAILVMVLFSTLAFSQGQGRGMGARLTPEERADQLTKSLGLNKVQHDSLVVILKDQTKQMLYLRAKYGDDMEGFRSAMQPLRDSTNKLIQGLLTDEQFKKYQEMSQNRRPPQPPPQN